MGDGFSEIVGRNERKITSSAEFTRLDPEKAMSEAAAIAIAREASRIPDDETFETRRNRRDELIGELDRLMPPDTDASGKGSVDPTG